jgi:hypothetical protein
LDKCSLKHYGQLWTILYYFKALKTTKVTYV